MIPKIVTQPTEEPISIAECRSHIEAQEYGDTAVDDADDLMILGLLSAAREYCENFTGLSIARKTYEIALDEFPDSEIELPMPPAIEIVSVTYFDAAQELQTMAANTYVLDTYQMPAWLLPASGTSWPTPGSFINAIKVRYISGYSADSDGEPLPHALRAAMLLVLGHLFRNREDSAEKALSSIPLGAEALMRPLRIRLGMA
jgi:uncharacterized phiE125 gp8 family phage protein